MTPFLETLQYVCNFLNQNDLVTLSQVCKEINETVIKPRLYQRIRVTKNPIIRTDTWFLDCGTAYVSGYRSVIKTDDQNDLYLYDRIERLLETSNLKYVKELYVEDKVFNDLESGHSILIEFIGKILSYGTIEVIDIRDIQLWTKLEDKILGMNNLNLKQIRLSNMNKLCQTLNLKHLKQLECAIEEPPWNFADTNLIESLNEKIEALILNSNELHFSSYRLFHYLYNHGFKFNKLKSLKMTYVHSPLDFASDANDIILQFLTERMNLSQIDKLELTLTCNNPMEECYCMEDFLQILCPHLTNLKSLSLIQKYGTENHGDSFKNESWDLTICKFLSNLPNVNKNLRHLLILHDPLWNGTGVDNVDGNYIRRRQIFNSVLSQLRSLKTLIVPRMLQSVAPYEIIACDFLWNGCTCSFCQMNLPKFDEYLMNHQYYDTESSQYKDIIPSRFVGYIGEELFKRNNPYIRTSWTLDIRGLPPLENYWNFHGHEKLHHFNDYDCKSNEMMYASLIKCVSHFFNGYMYHIVQHLPSLDMAILSGIYYKVDERSKTENNKDKDRYEYKPYVPNHETFFTTIVDTSSSQALKCPVDFHSIYD